MMIRLLTMGQVPEVLVMVNAMYDREMAPLVSPECTASFHAFASEPVFQRLMQSGKMHVWGAFDDSEKLVGAASMNEPYHVSMIYVDENYRHQGISRRLLDAMAQFGAMPGQPHPLTVNALEPNFSYFEHVGFVTSGPKQRTLNVEFTPMQRGIEHPAVTGFTVRDSSGAPLRAPGSKVPGPLKAVIALICVFAVAIFLYAASMIVSKSMHLSGSSNSQNNNPSVQPFTSPDEGQTDEGQPDSDSGSAQGQEDTGIAAIPSYKADKVSYEIQDRAFSEDDEQGNKCHERQQHR